MHEHPRGATSWGEESVKKAKQLPGAVLVTTDMCRWNLTTEMWDGAKQVKKPTGILTNSPEIAWVIDRRCVCTTPHGNLLNGRAKAAEKYTQEFVRAVLKGLRNQLRSDGIYL